MSTLLKAENGDVEVPRLLDPEGFKCAVFTAEWNPKITDALLEGALSAFAQAGVKETALFSQRVPGTVELVNAAAMALNYMPDVKAVLILGCVIRGETPHFDYVCDIVSQGTATLNAQGKAPVVFGVLTVEDEGQALDRVGGKLGNKGAEAAVAAIKMANLHTEAAGLRYTAFRD